MQWLQLALRETGAILKKGGTTTNGCACWGARLDKRGANLHPCVRANAHSSEFTVLGSPQVRSHKGQGWMDVNHGSSGHDLVGVASV